MQCRNVYSKSFVLAAQATESAAEISSSNLPWVENNTTDSDWKGFKISESNFNGLSIENKCLLIEVRTTVIHMNGQGLMLCIDNLQERRLLMKSVSPVEIPLKGNNSPMIKSVEATFTEKDDLYDDEDTRGDGDALNPNDDLQQSQTTSNDPRSSKVVNENILLGGINSLQEDIGKEMEIDSCDDVTGYPYDINRKQHITENQSSNRKNLNYMESDSSELPDTEQTNEKLSKRSVLVNADNYTIMILTHREALNGFFDFMEEIHPENVILYDGDVSCIR